MGFIGCKAQKADPKPVLWYHLSLRDETLPVWEATCLSQLRDSFPWAVSLILKRDPIENIPEWVSGHRMALTAACETFQPQMLIIESPEDDSLFYPRDTMEITAWESALMTWTLTELLPFVSTYASIEKIAWGRSFAQMPVSIDFWEKLLPAVRQAIPTAKWGISATAPHEVPLPYEWDFLVAIGSPVDSISWLYLRKPLYVFYDSALSQKDMQLTHPVGSFVEGWLMHTASHVPPQCRE